MQESLKPVAEQLAFNSSLLTNAFAGMTDEGASNGGATGVNSPKWLVGHIVTARGHILGLLGHPAAPPWDNVFEGAVPDGAALPTMAAIDQRLAKSSKDLLRALAVADARRLQTATPTPFPTVENTVLAAVAFLANHEAYHVGQVSFARRLMGLPGLLELYAAG